MPSIEHILSSQLCRKAVETNLIQRDGRPCAANFLRELLEEIDRLARHCQLAEFTEHGPPHLASLVERVGTWTCADGKRLLDVLTTDEACLLSVGILMHDIGMLAQREDDLDEGDRTRYASSFADLPSWIRRTHIFRIRGIVKRLMKSQYPEFLRGNVLPLVVSLARSHAYWPGQEGYQELERCAEVAGFDPKRIRGIAAILAVADLLDEDSGRCDSMTLFANKAGNLMNRAHWLRHLLTADKLQIQKGIVKVQIRIPSNLCGKIDSAVESLRNHLRSAQVYNELLSVLDASIRVHFLNPTSYDCVPDEPPLRLLLCEPEVHLMRTFPDEVMPSATDREPAGTPVQWRDVELKRINRDIYDSALGPLGAICGRSDLEITYAAATRRGEKQRISALSVLRRAAIDAELRGDIDMVRRLSTLVCRDIVDNERSIEGAFWAAVYGLHWAYCSYDLRLLETMLKRQSNDRTTHVFGGSRVKWRIVSFALELLRQEQRVELQEIIDLVDNRLEFESATFEPEEQIAWHDLIEAMWAFGCFDEPVDESFLSRYGMLLDLECRQHSPYGLMLAELSWRMAIQGYCLRGYGTWAGAPDSSLGRNDYHLSPDPGREAIAKVWISWFDSNRDDLVEAARQARKANPPGSELYMAALEAKRLVTRGTAYEEQGDDDSLHLMQEFGDVAERDDAYRMVSKAVTLLLNTRIEPKKDGMIYFVGRANFHPFEAFLGERIALRRWYLMSWQEVVGYHVQTSISLAYTMQLEGDIAIEPVLDGILRLPWGAYYAGNSRDMLKKLFYRIEPNLTVDKLKPICDLIAISPKRIGNTRHPGIAVLSDTISSDMLSTLIAWTARELQDPLEQSWPMTFDIWPELMRNADLTSEMWQNLDPLIRYAARGRKVMCRTHAKIIRAVVARAPWAVAGFVIRLVSENLIYPRSSVDWTEAISSAVGQGLLERRAQDWYGSGEHQLFVEALKALPINREREISIEFLARPDSSEGHGEIFEVWLETLESLCQCAASRKNDRQWSFGHYSYPVGPSLPITDETSYRTAKALDELWDAENATTEEITLGIKMAKLLFRATHGEGRLRLARSFLRCLASERSALGFLERESCNAIAWKGIANTSSYFPDALLSDICRLVIMRLYDLPIEDAWTQARFAMEVLLRSQNPEDQRGSQSALFAIRARVTSHSKAEAKALVATGYRLMQESNYSPVIDPLFEFMTDWIEAGAFAPDPSLRASVSRIAVKMVDRLNPPLSCRIRTIIDRLQQDVRMRVRREARGGLAEPCKPPNGRDAAPNSQDM